MDDYLGEQQLWRGACQSLEDKPCVLQRGEMQMWSKPLGGAQKTILWDTGNVSVSDDNHGLIDGVPKSPPHWSHPSDDNHGLIDGVPKSPPHWSHPSDDNHGLIDGVPKRPHRWSRPSDGKHGLIGDVPKRPPPWSHPSDGNHGIIGDVLKRPPPSSRPRDDSHGLIDGLPKSPPHWSHPSDDNHGLNDGVPKRPPLSSHPSDGNHGLMNVPKRPPLGDKRSFLVARPDEGGYSGRYYHHEDYQECDEGCSSSHDRRRGPPYKGGLYGYRWSRDEYSTNRHAEYRAMRNGFRRKRFYTCYYSKQRYPHRRGRRFLRKIPIGGKDSPHSTSGSSLSSRSRMRSFQQSQHRWKERVLQFVKTSRDTCPSVYSSKVLKNPSQLTEKGHAEAASKWANEKPKKSEENNLGSKAPSFIDQKEEPEVNTTDGTELCEDSQVSSRSRAIASKMTEIEKAYRQDCETFVMVIEMLVAKDPSLEKSIQFAMKKSLQEISERCVEELKHFITEYDNSTQDFGDPL
ncbi:hypothetical protein STEG23_026192 [Scotinomys teguina]